MSDDFQRTESYKKDEWYAYHFGKELLNNTSFDPDSLYGKSFHNCYVLMADLCSFTNFLQATQQILTINPLLTSFYTDARKVIHEHNGMLYAVMGDGVLAIWGLHNTDFTVAEVTQCANALIDLAQQYAEQWQFSIDHVIEPKGMRVGIAKGEIAVLQRDHEYTGLSCIGSVLNLATRLQTAAEPNQIVCSNAARKDIVTQQCEFYLDPFINAEGQAFIDTKNYGRVKAWILTHPDKIKQDIEQ